MQFKYFYVNILQILQGVCKFMTTTVHNNCERSWHNHQVSAVFSKSMIY